MNNIKGIIFDYGGTIDTNGVHWGKVIWAQYKKNINDITYEQFSEAYVHAERTLGRNHIIEPHDTFHTLLKKKIEIQAEFLKENYYINLTKEQQSTIVNGCYNKVTDTLKITCKVVEELSQLYPLVLVTNFYGNMNVVLQEFDLQNYFPRIIESSVVGIRKPNPALFALGVKELGLAANEILVVGDSYSKDIYPAHTLGCRTAWIKKEEWKKETPLPDAIPDTTIESIEELITLLTPNNNYCN